MALTDPSKRLGALPPYKFAELQKQVAEKRAAGIDVINLGIGDPDHPTFPYVIEAMQAAVADPGTHNYPSNRGRAEFREALAALLRPPLRGGDRPGDGGHPGDRRQGVHLQPLLRLPRPGRRRARLGPRLSGLYGRRRTLAGAETVLLPLVPELGFAPDLDALSADDLARARLIFINYPNNPTGAIAPDGFFEQVVELAREHEILVVHDNAYSETTYDGYVAPSFLATPGAKEVGVEVFSLSKGFNMTGWRCAAILGNADAVTAYWRLKTNVDSGLFEAVQLAGAAALDGPREPIDRDERDLRAPPRPGRRRPARDRRRGGEAAGERSTSGRRFLRATPRRRSRSSSWRRRPW